MVRPVVLQTVLRTSSLLARTSSPQSGICNQQHLLRIEVIYRRKTQQSRLLEIEQHRQTDSVRHIQVIFRRIAQIIGRPCDKVRIKLSYTCSQEFGHHGIKDSDHIRSEEQKIRVSGFRHIRKVGQHCCTPVRNSNQDSKLPPSGIQLIRQEQLGRIQKQLKHQQELFFRVQQKLIFKFQQEFILKHQQEFILRHQQELDSKL